MVAGVRDKASEIDLNPFDDPSATQYPVGFIATAKLVFKRFGRHNVTVIAAGIAFYTLLALLPTLIAMTSLYSLFNDPQEILDQVYELAEGLDENTRDLVQAFGDEAVGGEDGVAPERESFSTGHLVTVIIAVVIALFSASGATQKLMNIVNSAYEAEETRSGMFLRGLAYLFTAFGIVSVVILIGLLGVIPAVAAAANLSGPFETLVNIATYVGLAVLFPAALTVLYRYSPDREHRTPWKNRGALVAMILWIVAAIAFSFYARFIGSFGAAYALLGGIAGIIIFFQLTAISIIIGAEVNAVLENPANSKVPVAAVVPAHAVAPLRAPVDRINATSRPLSKKAVPVPKEPISLGKALAGVAALFFLGRNT